jgi:hypothetical protein
MNLFTALMNLASIVLPFLVHHLTTPNSTGSAPLSPTAEAQFQAIFQQLANALQATSPVVPVTVTTPPPATTPVPSAPSPTPIPVVTPAPATIPPVAAAPAPAPGVLATAMHGAAQAIIAAQKAASSR